jgi:hypothetical protein
MYCPDPRKFSSTAMLRNTNLLNWLGSLVGRNKPEQLAINDEEEEREAKLLASLTMCSYVPDEVLKLCVSQQGAIKEPSMDEFNAVVCMADIRFVVCLLQVVLLTGFQWVYQPERLPGFPRI